MKFTQIALSVLLVLGLSACKTVKTPDGKVPAEYLDAAKSLAGNYQGQFNGLPAEISLKFDGASPILTYTDATGYDLLGVGCESEIGQLLAVTLDPLAYVENAYFAFFSGHCKIEGQFVTLEFKKQGGENVVAVSLVKGHRTVHIPGQEVCYNNGYWNECSVTIEHDETIYDIIQGQFKKLK